MRQLLDGGPTSSNLLKGCSLIVDMNLSVLRDLCLLI